MEIVEERAAMLSNYEVFTLLEEIKKGANGRRKPSNGGQQQNMWTVTYETAKYLSRTACAQQTSDTVPTFLQALEPYKLTKAEKLQLLNHRPTSAVEIQLLIEESEERLAEEQVDELLEVIASCLPEPEPRATGGGSTATE